MISNHVMHVDIETYCELDLTKCGVYAYATHPSFEILLISYAFDDGPVRAIDLASNIENFIPVEFWQALDSDVFVKVAHNASFEMVCLNTKWPGKIIPSQWQCTMAMALQNGFPGSLKQLSEVLKLEKGKLGIGGSLINVFSKPCKPTKANGGRTRNLPAHNPDKWEMFVKYNIRDVEAEQEIYIYLTHYGVKMPEFEREVYLLDKKINDRGVKVDMTLVEGAIAIDEAEGEKNTTELQTMTGLENPNSGVQFKSWLSEMGLEVPSFTKNTAQELLQSVDDDFIKRAIKLKLLISKTSTAKYEAIKRSVCKDGRIHGLFQYYGASRSGRFAGRLVQLQNLPQNHIGGRELDTLRNCIKERDGDLINLIWGNVPDMLSQAIRTALVAKEGHKFIVADYSAIEARVIAWLAGEKWRTKLFESGGDIYCESASQMFGVPVVKHGVNGELRQKGKVAELACGYGGGVGALKAMGADKMGLSEQEMQDIVNKWRKSSPHIIKFWKLIDSAFREVAENGGIQIVANKISIERIGASVIINLPSKRPLIYRDVKLGAVADSNDITYMGQNQTTKKWERIKTYGGKLTENVVQAIARDILAIAMLRLDREGYEIVGHIHDEVIIEAPQTAKVEDVCQIMCKPMSWSKGLCLNAAGYETPYYLKD